MKKHTVEKADATPKTGVVKSTPKTITVKVKQIRSRRQRVIVVPVGPA
jgi:hypothetical protein